MFHRAQGYKVAWELVLSNFFGFYRIPTSKATILSEAVCILIFAIPYWGKGEADI